MESNVWEKDQYPSCMDGPYDTLHILQIKIHKCKKNPRKNRIQCNVINITSRQPIVTIDISSLEDLWLKITQETLLPPNVYLAGYGNDFLITMRKKAQIEKINPIIEE